MGSSAGNWRLDDGGACGVPCGSHLQAGRDALSHGSGEHAGRVSAMELEGLCSAGRGDALLNGKVLQLGGMAGRQREVPRHVLSMEGMDPHSACYGEACKVVGIRQPRSVVAPGGGGAAGILGAAPCFSGEGLNGCMASSTGEDLMDDGEVKLGSQRAHSVGGATCKNGAQPHFPGQTVNGSSTPGDVVLGKPHMGVTGLLPHASPPPSSVRRKDPSMLQKDPNIPPRAAPYIPAAPSSCPQGVWLNAAGTGACGNASWHSTGLNASSDALEGLPRPLGQPGNAWTRPPVVALPSRAELGAFVIEGNSVQLDEDVLKANFKRFESVIVGRLFGKKLPFFQLRNELRRRWERFGDFCLVTLTSDCFICYFNSVEARDSILSSGPWVIVGQVLGLDKWTASFSPTSMAGFVTPVWVRLPALPFYCWDLTNITRIASALGEPLWVDAATVSLDRGAFARVCIRIDLSKPLLAGVSVSSSCGKFFQKTEYEGLSTLCFRCGHVGHKVASCTAPPLSKTAHLKDPIGGSSGVVGTSALPSCSAVEGRPASPTLQDSGGEEGHELGPWTVVQRRKKKAAPRGSSMPGPGGVASAAVQHGVRQGVAACVAKVAIP